MLQVTIRTLSETVTRYALSRAEARALVLSTPGVVWAHALPVT